MFIKTIVKTGKRYDYYRLCESYRLKGKPRHRTIISLGKLEKLKSKEERKLLADRIEEIITGASKLFDTYDNQHVESYALHFAKEIEKSQLYEVNKNTETDEIADYQNIDLNSLKVSQANEIGAEWLAFQAIQQLEIGTMLENFGFSDKEMQTAIAHVIARCVFPASENKTADWINENSGLLELPFFKDLKINKNTLYKISRKLYSVKDQSEDFLSRKTNELFDIQDTVLLYDLTNTYFEGTKLGSEYAQFGRSKEMRTDAKLISLALVVNVFGFVKYSKNCNKYNAK